MRPQPATSRRVARAGARLNAVQALYQMDVASTPTAEVFAEFESHWIGREVEGVAHPRRRSPSSAIWWRAWCASSAGSIP